MIISLQLFHYRHFIQDISFKTFPSRHLLQTFPSGHFIKIYHYEHFITDILLQTFQYLYFS
jgi:hypothetical protein